MFSTVLLVAVIAVFCIGNNIQMSSVAFELNLLITLVAWNFQVTVIHINAISKNAADDKIRQALRRFAAEQPAPATVILISGLFFSCLPPLPFPEIDIIGAMVIIWRARGKYQVCSVQYCMQQLYTVNCTHMNRPNSSVD